MIIENGIIEQTPGQPDTLKLQTDTDQKIFQLDVKPNEFLSNPKCTKSISRPLTFSDKNATLLVNYGQVTIVQANHV